MCFGEGSSLTSRSVAEVRALLSGAGMDTLPALIRMHGDDVRSGVRCAVEVATRRLTRLTAEDSRLSALYELEDRLRAQGLLHVAGMDEVGRGAIAGPVSAGACVLKAGTRIAGLNDSKRLSPSQRERLAEEIRHTAVSVAVAHVDAHVIDSVGIVPALRTAMLQALARMDVEPEHVIVDGLPIGLAVGETAVVRGDSTVAAIAAASIVAKVERDSLMRKLAESFPHYGLDKNKGYGAADHLLALKTHGPATCHRRTFITAHTSPSLF